MTLKTFAQLWASAVDAHTDESFLVFRSQRTPDHHWTYGQFDTAVTAAAATMQARGVEPGSRIHMCLRNCPGFVAIWLAAASIGAVIVPVDPTSSRRELARQIERTAPALGVVWSEREADYRDAAPDDLPVIVLDETPADIAPGGPLHAEPALSAGEQPGHTTADKSRGWPPSALDPLAIMFTSGTTSEPKGVVLTQANYRYVGERMAELADLRAEHRWLVVLPLFHANAQYYCFASAIAAGASVALVDRFSASGWAQQAGELGATHASLFAAPIRMILARTPENAPRLQLTHVWYAQNLAKGHFAALEELCGVAPRQLYGMTETTAVVCCDRSDDPQHDSIGTVVPGREILLVSPTSGLTAAEGEPGLLFVSGRRGIELFAEYMDNPQANGQAFDSTMPQAAIADAARSDADAEPTTADRPDDASETVWFFTGDILSRNSDGSLHFVGRADDVVKVAGENVSLTEVEAALAETPGVLEVAVIAVPDPVRDVVTSAYVVPADPDSPPKRTELEDFAAANLPKAARPHHWQLVDALPRTSVGKIRRFALNRPSN